MLDRELSALSPSGVVEDFSEGEGCVGTAFAGRGLLPSLRLAAGSNWSGVFQLGSGNLGQAGTIVFYKGYLAWATSVKQPETLGSFLFRLGFVSRDDLDIVQVLYEESKGRKKLGRLMEESGIISRQVLRRCILLHVRLAVATLLQSDGEIEVANAQAGRYCVDQEMVFSLSEVLPEWRTPSVDTSVRGMNERVVAVLESLKTVPGHRACLVADCCGIPICARGFSATDVPGSSILATTAVTLLEGATYSATWTSLGSVEYASTEGTAGALLAHWLDRERTLVAVVLLDPTGKVGVARHALAAVATTFTRDRSETISTSKRSES